MMMKLFALGLLPVLLLSGCGNKPVPAPAPAPAPVPEAPAPVRPAAVASPALITTPAEAASFKLNLDEEGLRIFNTVSGSSRLIYFGMGQAEALAALQSVLKEEASVEEVDECEATSATFSNGLSAWFGAGRFTGWSALQSKTPVSTVSSVRVGSSRTALGAAYRFNIVRGSTLGVEFSAGSMSGLLSGPQVDAIVTHLWAGTTCVAR